jgi:tetratricopeptide (TPR) repeat protein
MKKTLLLTTALVGLLMVVPEAPAQTQTGGVDSGPANTRAARKAREQAKNAATNAPQKYPKATRVAPKQSGEPSLKKKMDALFALQEKEGSEDAIIAQADEIIADGRANAFDKSSAAYLAGSAWQSKETDNYTNAIKYYQQAVEFNGMHNNNHFQAMLQVAQMLNADEKQEEALKWVDRFLSETQSDDTTALSVKNQILMSMNKPELAIGFLEKQAAAKPDDTKLQMNLARAYQDAGQEEKAIALLERLRKEGKFTEAAHYEAAWRLLANANEREKDALAVIDEGLSKGILQPGYDVYIYQAQVAYADGNTDKAIAAWTQAAPMGKDGQAYLNLSQALQDKERFADAKAAAKSALDKGVKKPGVAWQVISISESESGNKAAALAAAREAAKYPETKKWADATIKASGGK